LAAIG
jgi:FLVCR family feline leukemia virus subgroup C receptor-related protein